MGKPLESLRAGVNVLLVDPFPAGGPRPGLAPQADLGRDGGGSLRHAPDEPVLLASYRAGDDRVGLPPVAFLEPYRAGAPMPDMPAWIDQDSYVPVPLERTDHAAWEVCPPGFRYLVEHGNLPDE